MGEGEVGTRRRRHRGMWRDGRGAVIACRGARRGRGTIAIACGGKDEVGEDESPSSHVEGRGDGEVPCRRVWRDERWVTTTRGLVARSRRCRRRVWRDGGGG